MRFYFGIVSALLLSAPSVFANPAPPPVASAVVEARLMVVPQSEACQKKRIWVTTQYRVLRVLRGSGVKPGSMIYVNQLCPRRPRGFSGWARGDAGRLRPDRRHRLALIVDSERKRVDPFEEGKRFRPLRTDQVDRPPEFVIDISSPWGAHHRHRISRHEVSIGRAYTADIRVDSASILPEHLRLSAYGKKATIHPTGPVKRNGKPSAKAEIVYQDVLELPDGTQIKVSLLTAEWFRQMRRQRK